MGDFTMTPAAGNQTRPGLLWSAFPHMHQIGSSIRVDLIRADGSKSCVISIPKWDFHWQGATSSRSRSRSTPAIACRPRASGTTRPRTSRSSTARRKQPKDVRFGEGSTDEMCLAGFTLTDF